MENLLLLRQVVRQNSSLLLYSNGYFFLKINENTGLVLRGYSEINIQGGTEPAERPKAVVQVRVKEVAKILNDSSVWREPYTNIAGGVYS